MSKMTLRMVTSLRGTMGDTTFRTLAPGKIVVSDKAAPPKYDYEEDEIARNVRADEFGGVNTLVPVVLDAAKKGFPAKERGQSAANLFTQHNTGILCTSTQEEEGKFTRTYNFRAMVLSAGRVEEPTVAATVEAESRTVTFTVTALGADDESSLCRRDDLLYAFVLDGEGLKGRLVELGTRGEDNSLMFAIPASWSTADLYVYAFARAKKGRKASPTVLLYPGD